jgi:ABC-type branched-subunit amino acid transport system substrate-binding protein
MEADRVKSAAVITILNEFGLGFGRVIMEELNNRNIDTKILSHFNPTERNFKNLIELVSNSSAHSIVLAADPATGARIVQEWDITRMPVRWYFASTLKSDVFVQNVPQKILNNAVGVAPQLGADAQRFSEAFAQRWYGETPTPEAVFYYDAMAVMALALVKMQVEEGKLTRSGTLPIHIRSVANPPGNRVGWNQLQRGVELIRNRQEIDYQGASGQVDFDEVGDVKSGQAALWGIEENRIKNLR